MDEVLKLVNRLQSACTLLGDTAGQKDADLPGLWEMLPSIVVIGGQVMPSVGYKAQSVAVPLQFELQFAKSLPSKNNSSTALTHQKQAMPGTSMIKNCLQTACRVLARVQCWRQ